jgi:hypothetical protein
MSQIRLNSLAFTSIILKVILLKKIDYEQMISDFAANKMKRE